MQQVQLYDQYQSDLKQVNREHALELELSHEKLRAVHGSLEESQGAHMRCKDELNSARASCLQHQQAIADLQRQLQCSRSDVRSLQVLPLPPLNGKP